MTDATAVPGGRTAEGALAGGTATMIEAVRILAQTEAILLDPVYTGKAMAGLIDLARKDLKLGAQ